MKYLESFVSFDNNGETPIKWETSEITILDELGYSPLKGDIVYFGLFYTNRLAVIKYKDYYQVDKRGKGNYKSFKYNSFEELVEDLKTWKSMSRKFESNWSSDVKTKFKPKEGTFKKKKGESDSDMANRVANYLKRNSKDLKQAMSRLNFYINRGGKNVKNKKALDMAKNKLREKYNK